MDMKIQNDDQCSYHIRDPLFTWKWLIKESRSWEHQCVKYFFVPRYFIRNLFRTIKFSFQRMVNGFAECDYWNLNDTIEYILSESLKLYIRDGVGCPIIGSPDENIPYDERREMWNSTIRNVINDIENISDTRWRIVVDDEDLAKRDESAKRVLDFISKYWETLWD